MSEAKAEESGEDIAGLVKIETRTLRSVKVLAAILGFFVISVFGSGWMAFAQVRTEAREAAQDATAGLATEQAALKANVKDLREEVADVKSEVRELRKDLRALFPRLPAIDGGQDGGR